MKLYSATAAITGNEKIPGTHFRVHYRRIQTIEEGRKFFGPIAQQERDWRDEKYFNALQKSPRSKLGIGEHDRAEAYIFGNGPFPGKDTTAHQSHFPVSVKVIETGELFIAPNEVVDLTARAEEFPWDTGESEIYVHFTVRRLILCAGSRLVVNGNVFVMNCLEAIADNIGDSDATIALSGSASVPARIASRFLPSTAVRVNGSAGADGEPLVKESTPLGLRVRQTPVACNGENGANGHNGADGHAGRNGAMLFLSDLRFGKLTGFTKQNIRLRAGAGAGFPGEKGTDGGEGGNGGNGAAGMLTAFGIADGGRGGNGGNGGDGGNGGRGGHGGLCCDVFVSVPPGKSAVFQTEALASPGGSGGMGGKGGKGGAAGQDGEFYGEENATNRNRSGNDGVNGITGTDGKTREAPGIHIYERPQTIINNQAVFDRET